MGTRALSTIMDLFVEGKEAVIQPPGQTKPMVVWVNKLSTFEQEDADRAGRAARARRMLEWDRDPDEQAIFEFESHEHELDAIVKALADNQSTDYMLAASYEVRAEEAWQERLALIDDAGEISEEEASEEHMLLVKQVNEEFTEAIMAVYERRRQEAIAELKQEPREEIVKRYRAAWRDNRGREAFIIEQRRKQVLFAARVCDATLTDEGVWEHSKCKHHIVRLMNGPADLEHLPEVVYEAIRTTLDVISMSPDRAGNSDAPMASSGLSEPQFAEEESIPSGLDETSPEPAGT